MANCNNGATTLDFLSLVPGGTAANATYQCGLTQYTCGNRKMPIDTDTHPVIADLKANVVGTPQNLGNGTFCCEVQVIGTMTYRPCNCCEPKEVYVVKQFCVPCSSAAVPTLTLGNVIAQPEPIPCYNGCCQGTLNWTDRAALTFSLNVTTGA
jgi:hypothetical protein